MKTSKGISQELEIGRAGEYLVMADLILSGQKCFLTSQGCNYDIAIDIGGKFIRIQVKTTKNPARMNCEYANPAYLFHARRAGRMGNRLYNVGEFDGFAFVALDTRQIAYLPFNQQLKKTVILRDRRIIYKTNYGRIAPYIDEFPINRFLNGGVGSWSNPRLILSIEERRKRQRESSYRCKEKKKIENLVKNTRP